MATDTAGDTGALSALAVGEERRRTGEIHVDGCVELRLPSALSTSTPQPNQSMSTCHRRVTGCHWSVTKMSRKCHQMSPKCHQNVTRCHQMSRGVTRCHESVTECHEVSQRFLNVTKCLRAVTKCHQSVTKMSRNVTECLKMSRNVTICHQNVTEMSRYVTICVTQLCHCLSLQITEHHGHCRRDIDLLGWASRSPATCVVAPQKSTRAKNFAGVAPSERARRDLSISELK